MAVRFFWRRNLRHGFRKYSTKEAIGFVGLGNMGAPMANNLMKKGHQLVVFDLAKSAVDTAVAAGAVKAENPSQVAAQANLVITMLPAKPHVYDCYDGSDGILRSTRPESLFIDCSTIDGNTAIDIAKKTSELGGNYLDAPVSGGVGAAMKGSLAFMVGGDKAAYEQAVPVLECMGRAALYCGGQGSGQAAKVCNNMLLGASMIATAEALQLGIK